MSKYPPRPNLDQLPAEVVAYIEALEAELQREDEESARGAEPEPSEPPTTINVITVSAQGLAKRTPRHFYSRQRRGGMGVFGLDAPEHDPPAFLLLAEEEAGLTVITDQCRAFRLAVTDVTETPVHGRGKSLWERFPARDGERIALVVADPLPGRPGAYLALASRRGQVRRIGSQYLGKNLQPGTVLYSLAEGGPPAAACWTTGGDDLFLITRSGQAIRFGERLVPVRGCLGMRVDPDDAVVGIAGVAADGGVFMAGDDGKGAIRLMAGFGANKAPGAGGKVGMKADRIIGVVTAQEQDDLFIISRLGKIIRFAAAEVPPKEGVVQGVNCMALRADECVALALSPGAM